MIEIWMENHLISVQNLRHYKSYTTQNVLQGLTNNVQNLHLVLVTLHGHFTISIEHDK